MSALLICDTCNKEYSLNSNTCVHCGEPNPTKDTVTERRWFNKKRYALPLLALPPIGLWVLWKGKVLPTWLRSIVTILLVAVIISAINSNKARQASPQGQISKALKPAVSQLYTKDESILMLQASYNISDKDINNIVSRVSSTQSECMSKSLVKDKTIEQQTQLSTIITQSNLIDTLYGDSKASDLSEDNKTIAFELMNSQNKCESLISARLAREVDKIRDKYNIPRR
ncbi:hypothetical protein [Dasania marina]|uniref:hypothetical protein n=1 Tax=Dasania marina TaxID=471499 RepID=UPI0030D82736|tara:strand:- start:74768 stop:75451 length:684 start_codon:yes stop_codon:yes gene_type:complete